MRRLFALVAGVAVASGVAVPSNAAEQPKKFSGTIAVPAADVGATGFGGQNTQTVQSKMNCPQPGQFDGVFYKFFDLKRGYTKFKAYGPTPLLTQPIPGGVAGAVSEYDIDLFIFDKKCTFINTPGGGEVSATEQTTAPSRNPAYYAVIVYYSGPYANLPVTLEAS